MEMKCRHCGASLGLEDLTCPHCGMPNEAARRHASDMMRYSRDYQETKEEVTRSAQKAGRVAARAVLLLVLIIANIVVFFFAGNVYSLKHSMAERNNKRHAKEYMQTMEDYLANEDYLGFYNFCQAHEIRGYEKPYEAYSQIVGICRDYMYLYTGIGNMIFPAEYDEVVTGYQADSFYDSLDSFYKQTEKEMIEERAYNEDPKEVLAVAEGVTNQLNGLLTTYLGLTEEEVKSLPEMAKTKRNLLLEEHLQEAFGKEVEE